MNNLKLIKESSGEFIPANDQLSLDTLYEKANGLGKVEIGSFGRHKAEITLDTGGHYICLTCSKYDLKGNLNEVIQKAEKIKRFIIENDI
jgi:hypothetical protein